MFNFPDNPTYGQAFGPYTWDDEKWVLTVGGIALVNPAPTITSSSTASVNENAVLAHSLTADEAVTWSITGGADAVRFELSGSTLRWLFNVTKDFEAPDDADANNIYVVTVRATDSASQTADQTISVTVTDVGDVSAEVADFLARTTGLDATHTNAYTALIDGLVADGVWAKLDVLHVYATQDTATAQLNLVSTSYPATLNGSPTFTVDRGYTGVADSSTVYINTGYNPTTAPSAKYTQNLAHLSAWNLTTGTQTQPAIGVNGSIRALMHVRYINGDSYYELNAAFDAGNAIANPVQVGHYLVNRTTSVAIQGYRNGSSVVSRNGNTTTGVPNLNIYSLGVNNAGTPAGFGAQLAMASIGSSLTSGEAGAFYTRLRTYMTTVGVP